MLSYSSQLSPATTSQSYGLLSRSIMSADLISAITRLQVSETVENQDIDDYLFEHRPRKRVRLSEADLKHQLEEDFLKPSYKFSTEWLNKLQTFVLYTSVAFLMLSLF